MDAFVTVLLISLWAIVLGAGAFVADKLEERDNGQL